MQNFNFKAFFKRNWDFIVALIFFILYVIYWSGKGERPLDSAEEISLNIRLIQDIIRTFVIAISILLSACIAIITFFLKKDNGDLSASKELIERFFSSAVLFFFALLASLYNLLLIPQVADKGINISYHYWTVVFLVVMLLLVLLGTFRMIRGIYEIKAHIFPAGSATSENTEEAQRQEKERRKRLAYKIIFGSVLFLSIMLIIFVPFSLREKDRKCSTNKYLFKKHFSKAKNYRRVAQKHTEYLEKIKNLEFSIYEMNTALKLKPISFKKNTISKYKEYLTRLKDERISVYKDFYNHTLGKSSQVIDYGGKLGLLENAQLFIADALKIKYKEDELKKLILDLNNQIYESRYKHSLFLAKKEAFKSNHDEARKLYLQALWYLENDNINDKSQEKKINELKNEIGQLEKKESSPVF